MTKQYSNNEALLLSAIFGKSASRGSMPAANVVRVEARNGIFTIEPTCGLQLERSGHDYERRNTNGQ